LDTASQGIEQRGYGERGGYNRQLGLSPDESNEGVL
jgi:hypothetical protein